MAIASEEDEKLLEMYEQEHGGGGDGEAGWVRKGVKGNEVGKW